MNSQNEYVISLGKLTLPPQITLKRLTLSIVTQKQQLFIQNFKTVKLNKVNFYRQNLIVSSISNQLRFNIYRIDDSNKKTLLIRLKPNFTDSLSITTRSQSFETKSKGYELNWESWLFSEDSQDMNQYTERDYSQLDFPFCNEPNNEIYNFDFSEDQRAIGNSPTKENTKRASSTDSSSSPGSDKIVPLLNSKKIAVKTIKGNEKDNFKDKNKIKTQVYRQLFKGISGLFFQTLSL